MRTEGMDLCLRHTSRDDLPLEVRTVYDSSSEEEEEVQVDPESERPQPEDPPPATSERKPRQLSYADMLRRKGLPVKRVATT